MIEMTSSVFASFDPKFGASETPATLLLAQEYGGIGVGETELVVPPASPYPSWTRPSARLSGALHSHPKGAPSDRQAERGPSSTVLSPHSSHTRMLPLERLFTGQPPPYHVRTLLAHLQQLDSPAHRGVPSAPVTPGFITSKGP